MHDLQTRLVKGSYGWGFRLVHRLLMPSLGRSCYAVTTVSKFSERHLRSFGVVPEEKLFVTYNGHEHALRWDPDRSALPLDGERPFVLALGQGEKHKNRGLLREIARPLDRMGLDLYVAGDVDPRVLMRDAETDLPSNLRLLGRISDDDLAKALDHALCFLFPSSMEGFGLPGLEAMARGCPVIVSDAACLPEIYGDGALYAPPDDVSVWADQVGRLAGDRRFREAVSEKGKARAELYSWRAIAEQYLDVMARADAGRPVSSHVPDLSTDGRSNRAELQPP
jgi:glycosyltransferase involved in cell wall biosynthesis